MSPRLSWHQSLGRRREIPLEERVIAIAQQVIIVKVRVSVTRFAEVIAIVFRSGTRREPEDEKEGVESELAVYDPGKETQFGGGSRGEEEVDEDYEGDDGLRNEGGGLDGDNHRFLGERTHDCDVVA